MDKKLFTSKQTIASALFGGPVPPGILIYINYKRMGDTKAAILALIVTLFLTTLFFAGLFSLPDELFDKIPDIIFTALYSLVVMVFFNFFMEEKISALIEAGVEKASNWSVAGFTVIGVVLNLIIIVGLAVSQPVFPGEVITYEGNEVYYNEEEILPEQVLNLASLLYDIGYFDDQSANYVHIDRTDETYQLTLPFHKDYWYDEEVERIFEVLKMQLSADLEGPVVIILEHYSLADTETMEL